MPDNFWALLDKHWKALVAAIVLLLVYRLTKKASDKADETEKVSESLVEAEKLIPPKKPATTGKKAQDEAATKAYNLQLKQHRAATYASKIFKAMYRVDFALLPTGLFGDAGDVGNMDGTDEDKILDLGWSVALSRLPFQMLAESYRKQLPSQKYPALTTALQKELSAQDYREFMRRCGLTPEAAALEIRKKQ